MEKLTKEQAKQILVQLVDNNKFTKAEYNLLMQAIEVLDAPAPVKSKAKAPSSAVED